MPLGGVGGRIHHVVCLGHLMWVIFPYSVLQFLGASPDSQTLADCVLPRPRLDLPDSVLRLLVSWPRAYRLRVLLGAVLWYRDENVVCVLAVLAAFPFDLDSLTFP